MRRRRRRRLRRRWFFRVHNSDVFRISFFFSHLLLDRIQTYCSICYL